MLLAFDAVAWATGRIKVLLMSRVPKNPVFKKKPNPGGFFLHFIGFYWVLGIIVFFLDAQCQRV